MSSSLLSIHTNEITTDETMYQYLQKTIGVTYPITATLRSDNILALGAYLPFFSAELLLTILNYPKSDYGSLRTSLSRLVKRGLLKQVSLPKKDGVTISVYYLTKAGYLMISPYIDSDLEYASKNGKHVLEIALHDYSLSQSLATFLTSPFSVQRVLEYIFTSGQIKKSLRIDAVCNLILQGDFLKRVYIEQDTGSETIGQLFQKMESYASHSLLNTKEHIFLSFRKSYVTNTQYCFSVTNLKKVLPLLEIHHTLKAIPATEQTGTIKETITSLLKMNGKDMNLSDVHTHIDELQDGFCTARIKDYNRQQLSFTYARRNSLISMYLSLGTRTNTPHAYLKFLSGCSLYALPSSLLMNYLPIIYYRNYPNQEKLFLETLSPYLPGLTKTSYQAYYPVDTVQENCYPITFQNVYTHKEGHVALEYISRDIGSFIRCYYTLSAMLPTTRLTIVLLVDSFEDAKYFVNSTNYMIEIFNLPLQRAFLAFLIPGEKELFTVNREMKRCVILPKDI